MPVFFDLLNRKNRLHKIYYQNFRLSFEKWGVCGCNI